MVAESFTPIHKRTRTQPSNGTIVGGYADKNFLNSEQKYVVKLIGHSLLQNDCIEFPLIQADVFVVNFLA